MKFTTFLYAWTLVMIAANLGNFQSTSWWLVFIPAAVAFLIAFVYAFLAVKTTEQARERNTSRIIAK